MSWAQIVAGGDGGRYTVRLDFGEATRASYVAALGPYVAKLQADVFAQQLAITDADAAEDALRQNLAALIADMAIALAANPELAAGGEKSPIMQAFNAQLQQLRALEIQHRPLRANLEKLQASLATARKRLAYFDGLQVVEERQAWCVDLTEDLGAGWYVATIDVPGESGHVLIAPGGRGWRPADGVLTARELMSPEQAFFNAAILPGWQKEKPTYRTGTITAIDEDADTADVVLDSARSSTQKLDVNARSSLSRVPVEYMYCNARAFDAGDHVVVQFDGQDWASPRVIGFVTDPQPCVEFPVVGISYAWQVSSTTTHPRVPFINASNDTLCGRVISLFGYGTALAVETYDIRIAVTGVGIGSPENFPGAVLECSTAVNATVWATSGALYSGTSASSYALESATANPAQRIIHSSSSIPSGGSGSAFHIPSGTAAQNICIRRVTWTMEYVTLQAKTGPTCEVVDEASGYMYAPADADIADPPSASFEVAEQPFVSFLGGAPIVAVTYKGIRREYELTNVSGGAGTWGLTYKAKRRQ